MKTQSGHLGGAVRKSNLALQFSDLLIVSFDFILFTLDLLVKIPDPFAFVPLKSGYI